MENFQQKIFEKRIEEINLEKKYLEQLDNEFENVQEGFFNHKNMLKSKIYQNNLDIEKNNPPDINITNKLIQKIIKEWITKYEKYTKKIWDEDLTSLRIISWISNADLILNHQKILFLILMYLLITNYYYVFSKKQKDYQIKEQTKNLGLCSIDNQLYTFKYATLKVRYLNSIKNTNFIVDDAI